ncbi:MAG: hypothetical protein CVV64_01980 [Candidatus Wallbacteria bacterium HGW-Wallbacteria-1]|jgi:hypothetical protein|uniref:Outer membrane lipoprotein BamD-like domain-containing protein n=1 Tax=Candidatus Wallbacteria bacterium HGW-Wallbacteria-1 TaxID=2013854 RepID=A0A2N1PV39_9BACT|nr:MAG: hypothetical protein CVV64_01980 [Candidatus Wallbacteria bacterium HGW-Wallbacteria-1]
MFSKFIKIISVLAVMFVMTWVNLNYRGAEKLSQGDVLLSEKRERLAYETYAEVISMHYAPFSPQVRKAFDLIVNYGSASEKRGEYEKALWAYALASNSFPPLLYTPYGNERRALKKRALAVSQKIGSNARDSLLP